MIPGTSQGLLGQRSIATAREPLADQASAGPALLDTRRYDRTVTYEERLVLHDYLIADFVCNSIPFLNTPQKTLPSKARGIPSGAFKEY